VKTWLALTSGLLVALLCAGASAQTLKAFPGDLPDHRILRIQDRVEELYAGGSYERALLIYQKELAPLGDKYAQYMVGYMHLNAQGTGKNSPAALAWYRLASERGVTVMRQARDELTASLSPVEITEANQIFVELWKSIGDSRLIMDLIHRDMDILKARTGSRISGTVSSAPLAVYRPSGETVGPDFYRNVRVRLQTRLAYIETKVVITDLAMDSSYDDVRILEEQVQRELAALDLP
jgi:hypothetical protein